MVKNLKAIAFVNKEFKNISNKRINIYKKILNKTEISFISLFFDEIIKKYNYQIPKGRLPDIKKLYYDINSKFFYKKKFKKLTDQYEKDLYI